jgi:hypothetical protein
VCVLLCVDDIYVSALSWACVVSECVCVCVRAHKVDTFSFKKT